MSSYINTKSTRLSVKDNFDSTREMKMSQFLKKMNEDNNNYYENNLSSNPHVQSTNISNLPTNQRVPDIKSMFNYNHISKQQHTPQYSNLSSKQFDKIVNQKVNTFENFRIPQASTPINNDYQQIPPRVSDTTSQKIPPPTGSILKSPLMTQKISPTVSSQPPIIDRTQSYTPEIGNKRRLSSSIYQSLIKTYKNIGHQFITQIEIEQLLDRHQLTNKDDKNKIKEFVALLKTIINNNMTISEQSSNGLISDDHLFEKDTKENVYNLLLDTKDRDKKTYPNINHFSFSFGGHNVFSRDKENVGYINRNFNNVKCAELLEVIIPRETEKGDKYQLYPYLLIDIEEFGNTFQGTNESLSSAFGKISFGKVIGNYAYYNAPKDNQLIKYFNPRISLSKMTIRIKKPDGQLFNFGKYTLDHSNIDLCLNKISLNSIENEHTNNKSVSNSENNHKERVLVGDILGTDNLPGKIESNITLLFKINCLQRSLDTMFLNKRDS